MIFNSVVFLFFFPAVFLLYWFCFNKSNKSQNSFLLVVSYIFYGWWDYRFLFLLMFSTGLDFFSGNKIFNSTSKSERKMWLIICVFINLGLLVFFKYYNFFADSLVDLFAKLGYHQDLWTLQIILPVGISFYTFHGLSYIFDIYNNKIKPSKSIVDYSVFVSFFPLLVAGPIERATHLLPEFYIKKKFDYRLSIIGLRQILWGLFKKVVIADNCGIEVDRIFQDHHNMPGTMLILGAVYFSIQIYADFSGYSDIAIGLSRMMGFEIINNFNFPYFARNIAEFWKKWHISLTSWFRDYLYIPLGGSKVSLLKQIRNTLIVFLISGFWHGANWTFIFWGAFHAFLFIPLLISGDNKRYASKGLAMKSVAKFSEIHKIIFTNILVITGWVFFRSVSLSDAFHYLGNIIFRIGVNPGQVLLFLNTPLTIGIVALFSLEWFNRKMDFGLSFLEIKNRLNTNFSRLSLYFFLCTIIILNLPNAARSFIYFQF